MCLQIIAIAVELHTAELYARITGEVLITSVTAKLDVVIEALVATPAERMLFKGSAALIPARFVQFWLAPLEQLLL